MPVPMDSGVCLDLFTRDAHWFDYSFRAFGRRGTHRV
jgi:hypothetical protein